MAHSSLECSAQHSECAAQWKDSKSKNGVFTRWNVNIELGLAGKDVDKPAASSASLDTVLCVLPRQEVTSRHGEDSKSAALMSVFEMMSEVCSLHPNNAGFDFQIKLLENRSFH